MATALVDAPSRASIVQISPASTFGGTTSFVPATSYKMLVEMFGHPDTPNPIAPEAMQRNLQPDDILGQYVNRELKMVSNAVTAIVLNDRASAILNIFPPVETLETAFTIASMEPNMVPWSRVTNFGIPRELTYSSYAEGYTTQRKKQMARIEKNFLLDPNYGPQYIRMLLTTLAANAKMTVNMEGMLQAVEQPFRNMFYSLGKRDRVDHLKLMNAEQASFGIANRNQQAFFNALIKALPDEPEIAFDTVLGPMGVFAKLRDNMAEGGGPIQCERIEMNPETKAIQAVLFKGAKSVANISVASRSIALMEFDVLRINTQNKTDVFRPFVTQMTLCDVVPFEVGSARLAGKHNTSEASDVFAYVQTPNSGSEQRFEYAEALKYCFLFDEHTGEPSGRYRGYVSELNRRIVSAKGIPNARHPKHTAEWRNATSANDEDETIDFDTFKDGDLDGRVKLDELQFRNTFFAVTYDPAVEMFRVPELMGDYHLRALRTERVVNAARALIVAAGKGTISAVSSGAIDELVNLVVAIRSAPWNDDYSAAVIRANAAYLQPNGHYYNSNGRRINDGVPQWTPNEYGALRLPEEQVGNLVYPPGYASWAGIQTLAAEAGREGTPWVRAGETAQRAVETLESLYVLISGSLPHSDLVDGSNTAPWFHVDDGGRSVLFDTLVQLRTGLERPGPVFLRTAAGAAARAPAAPRTIARRQVASMLTIADDPSADEVKAAVAAGRNLDAWLALGDHYNAAGLASLKAIVQRIESIRAIPNITIAAAAQGQASQTVSGARVADAMSGALREAIGKRTVDENTELLQTIVEQVNPLLDPAAPDATRAAAAFNKFSELIKAAPMSGKATRTKAIFTDKERSAGQKSVEPVEETPAFLANAEDDTREGQWLRSPLVEVERKNLGTLALPASAASGYTQPVERTAAPVAGAAPPPAPATTVQSFAPALARSLAASLQSRVGARAGAPARGPDPMNVDLRGPQPTLGLMLNAALLGADTDDLRGITSAARAPISSTQSSVTFGSTLSGPGSGAFFGPWQKRLDYLRKNVPNATERLVALALLMSRNSLQTHLGVAAVGAPFIALEDWRTGIQVDTAALIRLIRGSQTGFSVIARISVVPTLEGVTGDYAITGEMFHGVVFPNRKNIDMLLGAYIMNFRGGRYNDYITDPSQLLKNPVDVPSGWVLPETAEATRREYPCQLFGDTYYYQPTSRAPSPYAKRSYHDWAKYVAGDEIVRESVQERQRVSYWNRIRRSYVGHRAPTRVYGDHGRFDVRKPGTGGIGRLEFNISNAWEAMMGGQTPTMGEDRMTAS